MSNPITSVPEPSEKSSDPLANIITQVSPNSVPAARSARPPRTTAAAAATGAKKAAKKKAKEAQAPASTDAAVTTSASTAGPSGVITEGETSATAATTTDSTAEKGKATDGTEPIASSAEDAEEQTHSQKPSSTLVGTSSLTRGSNIVPGETQEEEAPGLEASAEAKADQEDAPSDAAEKAKLAGEEGQKAAQAQSASAEKPKAVQSTVAGSRSDRTSSKTGEATPSTNEKANGTRTAKPAPPKKKTGFVASLVAFLTCSSGAAGIVAEEEIKEKGGATTTTRGRATNEARKTTATAPTKATTASRSTPGKPSLTPSRRASFDKAAVGGTRLPREETGDVMSGAVVPPGSTFVYGDGDAKKPGSSQKGGDDDEDDGEEDGEDEEWLGDELDDDEDQTEEQRLIMQGGAGIPRDEQGNLQPLLGPIHEQDRGRKCLVLDLDETLVHSSFKMISNADFTVPVEIEGSVHNVYVIKRPGVDEFMRKMGELYEVVVFTASLSKYADPVLDILDIHQVVRHRLFRESCYNHRGNYVKDLSQLGRDIETSIIIDNSPASYIFHPNNAVPISSWFNDPHDTELTDLCPFLAELADVEDVRAVLDGGL